MTKIFGKLRRFGHPVIKKLPVARTWPQQHKLLLESKNYVYNVRTVEVSYSKRGKGNAGTRFFMYFELPALKFWNPDVSFKDVKVVGPRPDLPRLTLEMANGETIPIPITPEMKQKDILSKLLSVCGPSATKIPTPSELVQQLQNYQARRANTQSTPTQPKPQIEQPAQQEEELPHKQYEKPKRKVTEVKVTDS